jgi:acyl-CoA dehydrogenase
LALMSERAPERQAFGGRLADQSGAQEAIAKLRREIEQPRLPVLKAAWMIDEMGAPAARNEISMIEAVADRAMQIFGAMGLSPDMPLADTWPSARPLRVADWPDAVHPRAIAQREVNAAKGRGVSPHWPLAPDRAAESDLRAGRIVAPAPARQGPPSRRQARTLGGTMAPASSI